MCGICGYILMEDFSAEYIYPMTDILTHRGPDGCGHYIDAENKVALGHRRLKVIDLSDNGKQPMCDDSEQIWLTYNGEVYNFDVLRRDLNRLGYNFKSRTDTEVVIYAYKEYGRDFIHKLNGDFAFALWDGRTKELLLYRDRVGVKPLYYAYKNGLFAFASEIKSLLKHPALEGASVNEGRIADYFGHSYVFGEETMYEDIYEVQPGECLSFMGGKLKKDIYHDFTFDHSVRELAHDEQIEEFCRLFDDSIKIRLRSDVPVGIYLSGGIDSSYMTARLKTLHPYQEAHSYSLGFDYGELNEFKYSDYVSERTGTSHTKFNVSEKDFTEVINKATWFYDEPLAYIVSIPQYYLALEAKKHITVALSGTGGDELFAGYSHYLAALKRHSENIQNIGMANDGETEHYQASLSPALIASEFKSCSQKYIVDKLFKAETMDYRQNISKYFCENDYPDFLSKMLYMDFKTYVVAMLNKDDKMNMAWGIEGRFPYLDYRVVQFALSMSPDLKIKDGTGKWVLKSLCGKYFNDDFIFREKQAFPTPAEYWLTRAGCMVFSDAECTKLQSVEAKKLLAYAKNPAAFCESGNSARRMWSVYCLERWLSMLRKNGEMAA